MHHRGADDFSKRNCADRCRWHTVLQKRANGSVIRDKRATLPRLRIEATLQAPDRKRYGAVAPVEVYGLRLILKTKRYGAVAPVEVYGLRLILKTKRLRLKR